MNVMFTEPEIQLLRRCVPADGERCTLRPESHMDLFEGNVTAYMRVKNLVKQLALKLAAIRAPIEIETDWEPGRGRRIRFVVRARKGAREFVEQLVKETEGHEQE